MKWLKAEQEKYVITDFGQAIELLDTNTGDPAETIPRYGVWKTRGNVMEEVIETSDDLEYLKEKYNVTKVVDMTELITSKGE